MADIILCTINARYAHASLGLRYLFANLGELQPRARIEEFVLGTATARMAECVLRHAPRVIGLGVYIWNTAASTALVAELKRLAPEVIIVLGGPEVSFEIDRQPICALADHVVTGQADLAFAQLARRLLDGPRPLMRVVAAPNPPLEDLVLPYDHYCDADIAHRVIYVEASRGCPFKCAFCLSALDKTAWPFALDPLLDALARLRARGARRFKFVDRTFNLKVDTSLAILAFFSDWNDAHPDDRCFAHFELIPDHLPVPLRAAIARFAPGGLQFEIGIQSFDQRVQQLISRRQDNARAEQNLRWLREQSSAHLHVDLIAGLPGETLAGFAAGFDRLVALRPHEIQLGMLKRLRGAPITAIEAAHGLVFEPHAPYTIVQSATIDAATMADLARMAKFWDALANSGRAPRTSQLIVAGEPFARFFALSRYLFARFGRTHGIALEALLDAVLEWLVGNGGVARETAQAALFSDYSDSGARGRLAFMSRGASIGAPGRAAPAGARRADAGAAPMRQARFIGGRS